MVKIQNTITISIQQSISKAQLGRSEPRLRISQRRKQQFLRSLKHLRRRIQLYACKAAAMCKHSNSGFFILLRWLIGFFLLPNSKGFFLSILLSLCVRSSLCGPRQDLYQTLIKEFTTTTNILTILYLGHAGYFLLANKFLSYTILCVIGIRLRHICLPYLMALRQGIMRFIFKEYLSFFQQSLYFTVILVDWYILSIKSL